MAIFYFILIKHEDFDIGTVEDIKVERTTLEHDSWTDRDSHHGPGPSKKSDSP